MSEKSESDNKSKAPRKRKDKWEGVYTPWFWDESDKNNYKNPEKIVYVSLLGMEDGEFSWGLVNWTAGFDDVKPGPRAFHDYPVVLKDLLREADCHGFLINVGWGMCKGTFDAL